jgi:hypothetical protein
VAGEAIRAAVQLKRGGDMKGLTTLARRLEAQGHFRAAAAAYSLAGMRGKAGLMAFRRRLGQ